MKVIGIQISANEAILVVLNVLEDGSIVQSLESCKLDIANVNDAEQIKQFRDQVNATFDSVAPDRIALLARNAKAKGRMMPSPISFKLEGIIQLYERADIQIIWPQTLHAFYKKNPCEARAKNRYQDDAFALAYYLTQN